MSVDPEITVLHYLGADDDRGGVVSVLRALASAGRFACVLGVNPGFQQRRVPPQATREFARLEGEQLGLRTFWRARGVAEAVRTWLHEAPARVFHGHSRAGLAVALWLHARGEHRVVVTVHSYGRRRWFYRWAAARLGDRLFWLTPAMKRYYGVGDGQSWAQCMPGCLPESALRPEGRPRDRSRRPIRLGGAGLLVAWKGWHLLLQALAVLPPETRAQLRFVHIGSADKSGESQRYAEQLRSRTAELGLTEIVEWRGEQASSAALFAEVDCAVVLSDQEPFSMVMLEALAAGIPVLASAAGGPADVLSPRINGWLFESGNASGLAQALANLVGTDAWQQVRIDPDQLKPFMAATVAAQWVRIYADALRDRGRG